MLEEPLRTLVRQEREKFAAEQPPTEAAALKGEQVDEDLFGELKEVLPKPRVDYVPDMPWERR